MRFYSTEQLGPSQSQLPSGALLCQGVVIARTGPQLYHAAEIGVDATSHDGMVAVLRDEDEVFDEHAMASFEGAPITMRHPFGAVAPDNWHNLSVGHVQNVHRQGDTLVADLVVSDKRAIDAIRNGGWRGVSCGYNADYAPAADGQLRQTNIVGNHVALLPPDQEPRCGDMCMIGDAMQRRQTTEGGKVETMTDVLTDLRAINASLARLRRRTSTRDQADPQWQGTQQTNPGGSDPTLGGTRVLKLDGPASSYAIQAAGDGVWLIRIGDLPGMGNNGQGMPSGTAATGDAISRHRRTTAARDAGAAFAAGQNARMRQHWRQ